MSPVSAQPYASTQELFTLHSGETVDSSLTSLKSENLYLIVETDGKCENGDLSFTLKSFSLKAQLLDPCLLVSIINEFNKVTLDPVLAAVMDKAHLAA